MKIGCADITWNTFADARKVERFPLEQLLSEVARAGFAGKPVSLPPKRPAAVIRDLFANHDLTPLPGYFGATFWDKAQEPDILQKAHVYAQFTQAVGCTEMYAAESPFRAERRAASGHVRPEDAMSDEDFKQFAATLNKVGEIALRYGVSVCYHNHVGSVIETRAEIDRLFSLVDRRLVFQGPDIGHLVWAGGDALQFCRDYGGSIKTVHIKDIDPKVLAEGRKKQWDYQAFSDHGIFTEIGQGCIDFPAVLAALEQAGYDGWIVVETDVTQKSSPSESAAISRKYLKSIGY